MTFHNKDNLWRFLADNLKPQYADMVQYEDVQEAWLEDVQNAVNNGCCSIEISSYESKAGNPILYYFEHTAIEHGGVWEDIVTF